MLVPYHSKTQSAAVIAFSVVVLFHVWLRLHVKARKARLEPRGKVHTVSLLAQIVRWYIGFWALALVEWWAGLWTFHWPVAAVGGVIYTGAAYLQWKAFQDLGHAYSPDIEIKHEQQLVQTGLYGIVRHPLLSSLALELLGVTLFLNAYIVSCIAWIGFIHVLKRRMKVEEQFLLEHFGEAYETYCKQTGALFPRRIALLWPPR